MKKIFFFTHILLTLIIFNIGCNSNKYDKKKIFAIPLQPTLQQEIVLTRIEQILTSHSLSNYEYGQLLYERGVIYDSLGLKTLARNDFLKVLNIRPDIPEIFNFLGIYFIQSGNYENAYEAFDSALELNPNYRSVLMNRGIALYYGGRYKLAQEDLLNYYKIDPNDPFRSLWLYIIENNINKKKAKDNLIYRFNNAKKESFGWNLVEYYIGYINNNILINRLKKKITNNVLLAEYLSRINFYLGKYYLYMEDKDNAIISFKLSIANNVHYFIEHRCSLLELSILNYEKNN
ncbi:Lipoprotein NlpI [Candidatus Providencia siddallii]|uniref:Lipoprotein NlpI n=1 Tax=Candidatus Providencia siddallii TaxID=1715285 RepID=A0ABP1CE43_9GAMM